MNHQAKKKLSRLKQIISDSRKDILIGIDGGIKKENIAEVAALGVDVIVAGSSIFDGKDPKANAEYMMKALEK